MENTTLKEYRKAQGISQADLAKICDVQQPTISKLERGADIPSLPLAVKIETWSHGAISPSSWLRCAQ